MSGMEAPRAGARDEEHTEASVRKRAYRRWLAITALVVIVGGYGGWRQFDRHQTEVATQQAVAAAVKYAVALMNFDSQAMDRNVATLRDGATGEFKQRYDKSHGSLRTLLLDHQATAQGQVVESVVKSASANKVEVLLFVEQLVSNVEDPDGDLDSRIKMTMEKVDGRWLASKVDLR